MGIFDKVKGAFNKQEEKDTGRDPVANPPIEQPPAHDPVVDWIIQKRTSNTSDDEIKRTLLAHNHSAKAIEDALKRADAAMGLEPMPSPNYPDPRDIKVQPKDDGVETYDRSQSIAEIENLIDDRVKKVRGDLDKLMQWKQQVDSDMQKLQAGIEQLTDLMKDTRDAERQKFTEYDEHLSQVKVELKATQEVFKKGLPEFTKGIQELSRIVKKQSPSKK